MDAMDLLAADLSCALEESKYKRGRHWKHRRSRSTSNLLGTAAGAGIKTESDNSSSDEKKSDNAERSFAKLTLHNKSASKYSKQQKLPMQSVVESDSFNELFGGCSQPITAETKRRRRHKRVAVDASELSNKEWGESSGMSSITAVVPKRSDPSHSKGKKKVVISDAQVAVDFGKRKRGHKDRPAEAGSAESYSEHGKGNSADNYEFMDEDMNSDKGDTSSVFSSSESEDFQITCDEGQEGDDEQSDWVGEEWVPDDSVDPEERRRDLILRRLRNHSPSREIRAGKRRVHPHKPVFSIRTSANEQLSKFLQDPEQLELKLHPMRKSERVQLSHIASLYSLQMHYPLEDDESEKGFTCPILTKTSNTAQMDSRSAEEESARASWLAPLWLESDSKRIKK